MKFFCIGRNYTEHASELANAIPSSPLIFMKPSTAYLANGSSFFIPDFSSDIHYELELIVKINQQAKAVIEADALALIDSISVGIDFTARDIQSELKQKSWPWELAKGFDHSAVVGEWRPFDPDKLSSSTFSLEINKKEVQFGKVSEMIFSVAYMIHYISQRFTLQKGDILFTGTPAGVGQIRKGDLLEGYLNNEPLLICDIK
jgi:2-keto-4-pentenoate hydratase/2-oxohepta-3-ene-1,7-dioic acid hydratase in catechol pathway